MLRKTLFASALSGALAFAPMTATPAFAAPDAEDYAKILLGILAVGAIANALENERERERAVTRRVPLPNEQGHRGGHRRHRGLPARCEFEVRTRRGYRDVFGRHCLERAGVRVDRLPEACEFEIRTERGWRTVYGSRCLRDYGYRVEARRR